MLSLTLKEVAEALAGRLLDADPATGVSGVSIDSRTLRPGDLYIGLRGERFDGDAFAGQALAAGAAAVVVGEAAAGEFAGRPRLVVADGREALQRLAATVRRRSRARVVAVTGSAGKTATKDILDALLRPVAAVVATGENRNNEVGVPLTVLEIDEHTDVAIVEMGMRGRGQIAELAAMTRPDLGVITKIAPVHLELLGSMEAIAAAKAELLEFLADGVAIVPAGEPLLLPFVERHAGRVITFAGPEADVHLVDALRRDDGSTLATVSAFGQWQQLEFNFCGEHYLHDALAALAAFVELGYGLEEAVSGAASVAFSELRGAITPLAGGGLLLNDAYNANPAATMAALDHLAAIAAGRPTVALLGDMYELGATAAELHRQVGEHAADLGVRMVAVGELARDYLCSAPGERWYETVDECRLALADAVPPGHAVLVKGSRALRLERLAEALKGDADA